MKIFRITLACSAALAIAAGNCLAQEAEPIPAAPGQEAPVPQIKEMEGTICPVLGGPIDKKISCDYKGVRYYFCCVGCQGKFKADPEKYIRKMPEDVVHNAGEDKGS